MALKRSTTRGYSFQSFNSLHSHLSHSSLFSEGHQDEISRDEFTVVNSSYKQIEDSKSNLEFKEVYHEIGYRLALPNLCKLISSSEKGILAAGGVPMKQEGMGFISIIGKTSKPHKLRYFSLKNSKLKVYKKLEDESLKKEASFTFQRIYDIRYFSSEATSFRLVFLKKKPKKQGVMARIKNRTLSNASFSRGSFRRGKKTATLREQDSSVFKRAREQNKPKRMISSNSTRKSTRKSRRDKRAMKRSRTKRDTDRVRSMKVPSLTPSMKQQQVQLEEKKRTTRNLLIKDDDDNYVEVIEEEIELKFNTKDECHEWLIAALVETENQSKLFETYLTVLEDNQKDNYEIVLRKAVDMLTVARGVRDKEVWSLREKLAKFLEDEEKYDEAKIWYNLSHQNRQDISILDLIENARIQRKLDKHTIDRLSYNSFSSFGSMFQIDLEDQHRTIAPPASREIAIDSITLFFKQYAQFDDIKRAQEEAIKLVDESNHYLSVARKLEAKYARVPEGFEFYLIAAGKTPIEQMRENAQDHHDGLVV